MSITRRLFLQGAAAIAAGVGATTQYFMRTKEVTREELLRDYPYPDEQSGTKIAFAARQQGKSQLTLETIKRMKALLEERAVPGPYYAVLTPTGFREAVRLGILRPTSARQIPDAARIGLVRVDLS